MSGLSWFTGDRFGHSEAELVERAAVDVAKVVANMKPGEKLVVERFPYKAGENIFRVELKS